MTEPTRQIVYLVYGSDAAYHAEARFSAVSALGRSEAEPGFVVHVVTDAPEHYRDLPVRVTTIDATTLQQWFGPDRYNHRAKLCALTSVIGEADQTVLLDTDTFFLQPPLALFAAINEGHAVFDEVYSTPLSREERAIPAIAQLFTDNGIDPERVTIVNSGLVGLTRAHAPQVERAIRFCDAIYLASGRRFTTEQFVLGLSCAIDLAIVEDAGIIKHYWSRKALFRAKADAFLQRHGADLLGAAARAELALVTPDIPKPPALARHWHKLKSLLAPAAERQFFRELQNGNYDYRNVFDRACREAWWQKARDNLLERGKVTAQGVIDCLQRNYSRLILGESNRRDIIRFYESLSTSNT